MTARIVYVTARLPFTAAEAFAIPELLELRRLGVELSIVPLRPSGEIFNTDAKVLAESTIATGIVSPRVLVGALLTVVRRPRATSRAIRAMLNGQRLAVVAKNLTVLPKALWLAGVMRRNRVDHVHAYWASTPATVAFVAATIANVPYSLTAHSWDIAEANAIEEKVGGSVVTRVISESGRARLLDKISPSAGNNIRIIHLGVDVPEDVGSAGPATRLVVAMPASFLPVKGHLVLLEAVHRLVSAGVELECHLIGEGPLRGSIEAEVARMGLQTVVRFAGQLPHPELMRRYDAGEYDVVVLSSVTLADGTREGIPISLVEAMARGIPTIGSSCGGIPELLAGGAGMLVPEGDAVAFADAIRSYVADSQLRRGVGAAGRQRILSDFEVRTQTRRLLEAARIR